MVSTGFIEVSFNLDRSGLIWHPEIGDEVVSRSSEEPRVSLLFDPQGLTPSELRGMFVWLPSLEQLVMQIEAREAFIFHAGVSEALKYEAVVKTSAGIIEATAATLRTALGLALHDLLRQNAADVLH